MRAASPAAISTSPVASAKRSSVAARLRSMTGLTTVPESLRKYFASLDELLPASGADDTYHNCFGCGPAHPSGLRIRCFKTDAGVASPVWIAKQYEGPPGAAHGGIVAAYLDEILAAAVLRGTGRVGVTGELTVRYRRPVPIERAVLGQARLVADHGRYVDVEGELVDPETDERLATARGRFFPVKVAKASC
jgi:acyl-coenzyme A thioesterase PaaI-like protein